MPSSTIVVRDADDPASAIHWQADSPIAGTYETRLGDVIVRHGRFRGGPGDGVEVVAVDTGVAVVWILPTRGMGIWKIDAGGLRFGWDSPVGGPVHPSRVPIDDPSGIGWLDGFNELVVRCGLANNGAPEFGSNGQLIQPLHGRIANTPAAGLAVDINPASGRVEVIGTMDESRMFSHHVRLQSRIRMLAGQARVDLLDDVTNRGSRNTQIQLLYHVNVGRPVLGPDATIDATLVGIEPKDETSAEEIDDWANLGQPQRGYSERVYFGHPKSNSESTAVAMLASADKDCGLAVRYRTKELPWIHFWKNTAADSDGYVVGLEPATGLPQTRSAEAAAGRLLDVDAGQTISFRIAILPLVAADGVAAMQRVIAEIQDGAVVRTGIGRRLGLIG